MLGNKQVALGPLAVEAGIFAFLLLVATSSAIAELHGAAIANRLVRIGFVPLIASLLLAELVLALPASPDMAPDRLAAFNTDVERHAADLGWRGSSPTACRRRSTSRSSPG